MHRRSWLALLLALCMVFAMLPKVSAKSSSEIQDEIDALEEQADEIAAQREALEDEIAQTKEEMVSFSDKKLQIDQEAELLRQTIENINSQIQEYSALIAERQAELDELEAEHEDLVHRYQMRMRTIQERGPVSIWSVLLSADSFTDMISDNIMIEEIAQADQRMLQELQESAQKILDAKSQLADQKGRLEEKRIQLDDTKIQLDQKRAEADAMLVELNADKERLAAEVAQWEAQEAELAEEIAKKEKEYTAARLVETGGEAYIYTESGFIFPLSLNGFACLSSPYGMRTNPVTGIYCLHNGVDFAASMGTPIYASKSGVVTTACLAGGWGNYVVINHGDGFSTLYAHMTYFIVSAGEYVEQGETIGYVGSTGNSTGPHLHFTIFYDGTSVNPMNYVRIP
ncbi:MAG: murein hydrolase activator EnvC family protein [Faecousia sp.]